MEMTLEEIEEAMRLAGCIRWVKRIQDKAKLLETPSIEALARLTVGYLRELEELRKERR